MSKAVFLLCLFPILLWAHAHVFIDYQVHGIANEKGLQGVYVNWSFDRMFTTFVTKEFDEDSDGKLSKEEQNVIYKNSFLKWKEEDFYSVLKLNGKRLNLPTPQKFSARINQKKGVVEYTFYLPLNIAATKNEQEFTIHFLDKVIYVDFASAAEKITMKNKKPDAISLRKEFKEVKYKKMAYFIFSQK